MASSLCVAAAPAEAQQVAGATYSGEIQEGGRFTFTVAPDGARLSSFRMTSSGTSCSFAAGADDGYWEAPAIANGTFAYQLGDWFSFAGTFAEPQAAAGTARLVHEAIPGVRPRCDTGPLQWTAATTATPGATPAPPSDAVGPARFIPAVATPKPARRTYKTTLSLRRRGASKLAGRLSSGGKGCRSARMVTLKRGLVTVARTKSTGNGTFSFRLKPTMRGRKLRASVAKRTRSAAICAAARSRTVLAGPARR